jgi:nicotinate-nucleotide adenylyltransferase
MATARFDRDGSLPVTQAARPMPVLPRQAAGMRIGLLGGSFDPPHAGHRLASLIALRRLGLDRVWWVVTPGNPLKNTAALPQLADRMAAARRVAADPRIAVTGFEAEIGTRYTYDTIAYLKRRCPRVHFVWLMGADNLAGFHRWQHWRAIAAMVPIAVIDRPGSTVRAASAPAAAWLGKRRFPANRAISLPTARPPAWIFLHGRRSHLSSTMIRQSGAKSTASR